MWRRNYLEKCVGESYWQSLDLSSHFFTWEWKRFQLAKRYVLLVVRTKWRIQADYRVASEHCRTDMPDRLIFVMPARLSVRVEQIASHRTDLPENWYYRFFTKLVCRFKIRPKTQCMKTYLHLCIGKGKGVPNRPGVAQRVPGGLGFQISWHSAREGGEVVSLTHRPPLPPGTFLVLIFTRGWVDPRAMVRSEGDMSLKNPVTPPGIDPGTVRLVAQRLNHYATPGPFMYRYIE